MTAPRCLPCVTRTLHLKEQSLTPFTPSFATFFFPPDLALIAAVAQSVMKTGRCVIVHEAPMTAGAGAEMAAELQKKCFLRLEAPINRIGGWE